MLSQDNLLTKDIKQNMRHINTFAPIEGVFLPDWLKRRRELTGTAKLLYALLRHHGNHDGSAQMKPSEMSEQMGSDMTTLTRALMELISHGLVVALTEMDTLMLPDHPWMHEEGAR